LEREKEETTARASEGGERMGELLDRLHHEHTERRRRWFAPPAPEGEPPPPKPEQPMQTAPEPIDLELYRLVQRAEQIAAGAGVESLAPRPTCKLIRAIVAGFYRLPVTELLAQRRDRAVVWPRHVAIYLCCTMTTHSLPHIGRAFGGRDHTTVLHAKRRIAGLRETDARLRDELALLAMRIEEASGWREEGT
jgi:hypothetical protein